MTTCALCGHKLTVTAAITNHCRCGLMLCASHINDHTCTFDYRALERARLTSNLKPCVATKVDKI